LKRYEKQQRTKINPNRGGLHVIFNVPDFRRSLLPVKRLCVMKTIIGFSLPVAILLLTCILTGAPAAYFFVAVPVGLLFGFLLTCTLFVVFGRKSRKPSNQGKMDLKKTWVDDNGTQIFMQ
jgi:hypothetical protein